MYFLWSWAIAVFCLTTALARNIPHGRFHVRHNFPESNAASNLVPVKRDDYRRSVHSHHQNPVQKSKVHHTPGLLLPSISDEVDRHDRQHLVPQKNLQLYYEEGGSGTSAAYVSFRDLKHASVVLEHSHFVTRVQCTGQKLLVSFSDHGTATFALNAWKTANTSNIIIITNSESCSFGFPAERGWLLITSAKPQGTSTIVCDFSEVPAKDVSKTVEVNLGRTNPGSPRKNPWTGHAPKSSPASSRLHRPTTTSAHKAATYPPVFVPIPQFPGWPQSFNWRKHSSSSSTPKVAIPGPTKSAVASTSRLPSNYATATSNSRNNWVSLINSTQLAATNSQSYSNLNSITQSFSSPTTFIFSTSTNLLSVTPVTLSPGTVFSTPDISAASTTSPDNLALPTTSGSTSESTGLDAQLSTTPSASLSTSTSTSPTTSSSSGSILAATTAPSNTIQDFDTTLDDSIGYLDPSSSGFWSQLLPGVPSSQTASFGTSTKRLHRRDFDLVSIASSLTQAVSSTVNSVTSTVSSAVQSASDTFASAVASVVSAAVDLLNSLSPFTLGPFPFSATPSNTDESDFGPGVILSQSSGSSGGVTGELTTYCVGCGATGSFTLTGTVIFDAQEGISSAIFDISGNIHAQLELAAVASVSFSESTEKNIFTQGLPALTVTGLIVIGPAISLDVGATADFSITGGLAAGYQLDWPSITAHFDLTNDIYSADGLIPTGSPIFDYEGDVKASATVYGLISLTFGLDILSGKYKANVGLVDKPEIDTSAEAIKYSDYQLSQLDDGTVYCDGDSLQLSFLDSAYADVVFLNKTKTYPLTSWAGPSLSTCIGTESTVTHSAAATTTTDPDDPDPTDPADSSSSVDESESTTTTDSSASTASPAATPTTQEPVSTTTDSSNTSSLPDLTTTASVTSTPQATETSSSDSESTDDPSTTQTTTSDDPDSTTATEESTTTTATEENTTTTTPDENTTTTAPDENTTATTAPDENSTTSAPEETTTTTTAPDENTTAITTTDENTTTTAPDENTTTTAPDENTTTTAPDETTTATTPDENTTTTAPDETTTNTPTPTSDENTTTTAPDENTTTPAPDETTTSPDTNTATTSPDENTAATTPDVNTAATTPDVNTATITPDPSLTTTAPDENTTTAPDENTTTDPGENTATTTPDDSTATTSPDETTATTAPDESVTTTAPDENTTTGPDENTATTAPDENTATTTPDDNTATTTPQESTSPATATTGQSTATSTVTSSVGQGCDPAALADGYCCEIPASPINDTSIAYSLWEYCLTTSASHAAWTEIMDDCGGLDLGSSATDISDFISCGLDYLDAIQVDSTSSCSVYYPDDMDAYYMCEMENLYYKTKYNDESLLINSEAEKRKKNKRDTTTSLSNAIIKDAINGTTFISWAADGNLVVSNASSSFSSLNGNIVGDTESRLLHLYSDTISSQGVSRLRLATLDAMPLPSVLVTLAPVSLPSESSPILVAFTSAGSFYYLITCIMDEQAPKIFLATDVASGVSALQSTALQNTITGGTVTECGLMAWITG